MLGGKWPYQVEGVLMGSQGGVWMDNGTSFLDSCTSQRFFPLYPGTWGGLYGPF